MDYSDDEDYPDDYATGGQILEKLCNDEHIREMFAEEEETRDAFREIKEDPKNIEKHLDNPKVVDALKVLMSYLERYLPQMPSLQHAPQQPGTQLIMEIMSDYRKGPGILQAMFQKSLTQVDENGVSEAVQEQQLRMIENHQPHSTLPALQPGTIRLPPYLPGSATALLPQYNEYPMMLPAIEEQSCLPPKPKPPPL